MKVASKREHGFATETALPPAASEFHLFDTDDGPHLLLLDGSQIYKIDEGLKRQLKSARAAGAAALSHLLSKHGLGGMRYNNGAALVDPPIRALSLAVAGHCNLGCTYCYAKGGSFGGTPRSMSWEVAAASIHRLMADAEPGERVNLAFLGGEPLVNRDLIRRATELAVRTAAEREIVVGFSITTNGTLLRESDADFFEWHGFAVTISLDGVGDTHDRLRPTKSGHGTYDRVIANVKPLLARQRRMQVSARVTVTPANLGLRAVLDEFVGLGFHSVGFSPMLRAPSGRDEMQSPDLLALLDEMIGCGYEFERRTAAGERYPFANLMTALGEIHRGTHRPYPCGAGAGYFGVSPTGGLFSCHRFVEDEAASMGDVWAGVERTRQRTWLAERTVDRQQPCSGCWARYLCGGGCHYEVIHRGRPACDYIRGWLEYALGAYVRLSTSGSDLFARTIALRSARPPVKPSGGGPDPKDGL